MRRFIPVFLLLLALVFVAVTGNAASPPLVLQANTTSLPLSGHIDIIEDPTGTLTIQEASSPQQVARFKPDNRAVPGFGMTSKVYWVRFSIYDQAALGKRWLIELNFPHMDYVDCYVSNAGGFDHMQAGDMRLMSLRTFWHRNPVFPVVIKGAATNIYLRVDARGQMKLPLTVWSPEAFRAMDQRRNLIDGGYFGAMLVMVAYNFFIFLSLRDRNYLYYILDISLLTLYAFFLKGFHLEFVSGELPLINNYLSIITVPAILAGLLFCRNFLATRQNAPVIDRLIKLITIVVLLFVPLAFIISPEVWRSAISVATSCASITALSAGIVCVRKGYHPARYYVGARVFRMLGLFTFVLGMHGILPVSLLTTHGYQIGSLFEVLLLSFALTDRINMMQREREEARAEAIRSSQLAALGELAAGVAHEINTPLNTIINSADLLLEDGDRASLEHDAEVIKKQGRRIAAIVKNLLFFSRLPSKDMIPFGVADMLQGALDMMGGRLRKEHVSLNVTLPPVLPHVLVRPQQIEQVFLNLLTNGLHALAERYGDAADCKLIEISASVHLIDQRRFVRITFWDNGVGIPAHLLASVKNAFVTTKQSGTGLGLSICQQIIDAHGGVICLESKAGEYTKVQIDLPIAISV